MHQSIETSQVAERIDHLQKDIQRLLRELRRKERLLSRKDEELQNYLHTLSHEIRSPLVAIRGFSSLLLDEFDGQLSPTGREYLGRIVKNTDHLESLVTDMIVLSGVSLQQEAFEPTRIRDLVNEVLVQLQFEKRAKHVTIAMDDGLPVVCAHTNSLRQVFTNLLSNAIKYARPRAALKIHIGYQANELFHKFFVRDNGVGIPASQRQQIFTPFCRLGHPKGVRGNGLGLAIIKRLITLHGGEVWVDSRSGRGSTFYFTLPRAETKTVAAGWRPRIIEGLEV